MYFDAEYEVWFKCKVLKRTENFYVVGWPDCGWGRDGVAVVCS